MKGVWRKIKKAYTIGAQECLFVFKHRQAFKRFVQKNRYRNYQTSRGFSWQDLQRLFAGQVDQLLVCLKREHLNYIDQNVCDGTSMNRYAEHILSNRWGLFDKTITFVGGNQWHTDCLYPSTQHAFDPKIYFADIELTPGIEKQAKDIRIVWELNRLHQLVPLAHAHHSGKEGALHYLQEVMYNWSYSNPYLFGVNWMCPMEVAIRAINMVIASSAVVDADDHFLKTYVCLLYDHLHYLEHTWEYYDGRTSNHYLSDLVGYLYLVDLFMPLEGMKPKRDWVIKEVLKEIQKQVFADGTSYEGSTAYHRLVTELVYLFYLVCDRRSVSLPQWFYQTCATMFDAIDACMMNDHEMITIGDNDSGFIVWPGLAKKVVDRMKNKIEVNKIKHFDSFGLAIVKSKQWHVSLRHHAYQNKQPSGHFHNDVASVTVALHGIPILIDPGSYTYTGNVPWRNYFRSACSHNTFFLKNTEPVPFDDRVFALAIPEHVSQASPNERMTCSNTLYKDRGVEAIRVVSLCDQKVLIKDMIRKSVPGKQTIVWNFIFDSRIDLMEDGDLWVGSYQKKKLFVFKSKLPCEVQTAWISRFYGSKHQTKKLYAEVELYQKECEAKFELIDVKGSKRDV